MMPINDVPNEKPSRTCANCACYIVQKHLQNPLETQSFCRRDPAKFAQMRIETPRMAKTGEVINGRDGKPIMVPSVQDVYIYTPTQPGLVCFDGWRPAETLPGDEFWKG